MKKRFTKALAAFLCAVMVLSNNGLSTFADSLHSDVTGNDIAVYEENVSEVSGGEDIIVPSDDEIAEAEEIIEDEEIIEEEEYATFTDEFGEEHIYSLTASKNNIYDISGGELLSVTDEDGNALKGVVVIPENKGINKIGTNAFKGNEDITYVVLPEGTEIIADSAFSGCTKLRGASVPKGVIDIGSNAFAGDPSLIQLSIPKTVERIGNGAFKNCTKLYVVAMDDVDFS
nr:leucine-rich repeat domain-containing protein [Lachnospiraceae bacterium]